MGKGIFGGLFDFNRDGKMSSFERAAEIGFLHHIMESEKKETASHTPSFGGSVFTSSDNGDHDDQSLGLMDEESRRTALEDAGLDPDNFGYLEDL